MVACLVTKPRAVARPSPMAETASEALCRTPIVALHRPLTRLACRSRSNTLPSTRCTASYENRLASATWGAHDLLRDTWWMAAGQIRQIGELGKGVW